MKKQKNWDSAASEGDTQKLSVRERVDPVSKVRIIDSSIGIGWGVTWIEWPTAERCDDNSGGDVRFVRVFFKRWIMRRTCGPGNNHGRRGSLRKIVLTGVTKISHKLKRREDLYLMAVNNQRLTAMIICKPDAFASTNKKNRWMRDFSVSSWRTRSSLVFSQTEVHSNRFKLVWRLLAICLLTDTWKLQAARKKINIILN